MRVPFSQVFSIHNGAIAPIVPVHINGITMTPGVSFGGGISFGGIDLSTIAGKDLDVEIQNGVYVIKGYFNH